MNPRVLAAVVLAVLALLHPHLAALAVVTVIPSAAAGMAGALALCCRRLHREGVLPWA